MKFFDTRHLALFLSVSFFLVSNIAMAQCDSFFDEQSVFVQPEMQGGDGYIDANIALTADPGDGSFTFQLIGTAQTGYDSGPVPDNGFFQNLTADTYSLTVSNGGGCNFGPFQYTVDGAPCDPPIVSPTVTDNFSCTNPDGSIQVFVSSNQGEPVNGYAINIYPGTDGSTTPVATFPSIQGNGGAFAGNLSSGNYFIEVFNNDFQDCGNSSIVTILDSQDPPSVGQATIGHESSAGANDGFLDASQAVSGGSLNYSYEWYDDQSTLIGSTAMISNLAPGNYSLIVVDTQTGCVSNQEFYTINPGAAQCDPPIVSPTVTDNFNCTNPDGSIQVFVSSNQGEPVNGYAINIYPGTDGSTTPVATFPSIQGNGGAFAGNLSSGNYFIEVFNNDFQVCGNSSIVTILDSQDYPTVGQVSIGHESSAGANDGFLDASQAVSGGSGSYQYDWFEGVGTAGQPIGATASIQNLPPGDYTLVVSDINSGCSSLEHQFTIQAFSNEPNEPIVVSGDYSGNEAGFISDLQDALANANGTPGADIIDLSGVTPALTIAPNFGVITDDLTIIGPTGVQLTFLGSSPIFDQTSGNLEISNLTITGGSNTDGGGIRFTGTGDLSLYRVRVDGNSATNSGGGIYYQSSSTNSTIEESLIINNDALTGAGIEVADGAITIINSTIANNTTSGGIHVDGDFVGGAMVDLVHTTITGNVGPGVSGNEDTDLIDFSYSILFDNTGQDLVAFNAAALDAKNTDNVVGSSNIAFASIPNSNAGTYIISSDPLLAGLTVNGDHSDAFYPASNGPATNASFNNASSEEFDQTGATRTGPNLTLGAVEQNKLPVATISGFTNVSVTRQLNMSNVFSVEDSDEDIVELDLSITQGQFLSGASDGLTVTDGDGSDGTLVLSGTPVDLNNFAKELVYLPNGTGNGVLDVILDDGSGGATPQSTFTLSANADNALDFDGINDRVSIASGADIVNNLNIFTLDFWLKASAGADQFLMSNSGGLMDLILTSGGGLNLISDGSLATTDGAFPRDDCWHHVVIQNFGATDGAIFVDGVQQSLASNSLIGFLDDTAGTLFLGSQIGTNYADVQMDELAFWNYALSNFEIEDRSDFSLVGNEAGLLAYYSFDIGVAEGNNSGLNTLPDLGPSGYNGSLQSIALSGTSSNWVHGALDCQPPGVATAPIFGAVTPFSVELESWTAPVGCVDGYVVYVNTSNTFPTPTDGVFPTADDTWNNAGAQPIYVGSSDAPFITVSDLDQGTMYDFKIYGYTDCDGSPIYETTGVTGQATTTAAGTFTVSNTNDSGAGSLRQAMLDAESNVGPDIIEINTTGTITLASDLPAITEELYMAGVGADQITIDGNGNTLFDVTGAATKFYISNVTLQGGSGVNPVSNNQRGGAIYANGIDELAVSNVHFLNNSVLNLGACEGGAIYTFGLGTHVFIANSLFEGNVAGNGSSANGEGGALFLVQGAYTRNVVNSTFVGNQAKLSGGAAHLQGDNTITNCTFYNNETTGGASKDGINSKTGTLDLNNSIVWGNGTNDIDVASGILDLTDSNIVGTPTSSGGTITGTANDGSTDFTLSTTLADNGGTTQTLLVSGSAAVNAATTNFVEQDQTGIDRGNGPHTLGALEINVAPVLTGPSDLNAGTSSAYFGLSVSLTDEDDGGSDFLYDLVLDTYYNGTFGNSDGMFNVDETLPNTSLTGDESSTLNISGTLDEINAILATLEFKVDNDPGPRKIDYSVVDNWTGVGGSLQGVSTTDPADFGNGRWEIAVLDPTDTGAPGSLRAAMTDAFSAGTGQDIFDFQPNNITGTITLSADLPVPTNSTDLVVLGKGPQLLTIDGNGFRIFENTSLGRNTIIRAIRLINGSNTLGGAIYVQDGNSVTLDEVTAEGSSATNGGGVYLNNLTTAATLSQSLITGNTATTGLGGGLYATNIPTMTIVNSTIEGNSAPTAAQDGGGMHLTSGTFNMYHVTSDGNTAADAGNGLFMGSSADGVMEFSIFNDGVYLESTVSSNAGGFTSIVNLEAGSETDFLDNGGILYSPGDITDFSIGTLALNGGFTETILVSGSDAVNNAVGSTESIDQRFENRTGTPTLGAVEINADPTITVPGTLTTDDATIIHMGCAVNDTDEDEIKATVTVSNAGGLTTDTGVLNFDGIAAGASTSGGGTASLEIFGTPAQVDATIGSITYDPQGIPGNFTITVTVSDDPADPDLNNEVIPNETGGDNTSTDSYAIEVTGTYVLTGDVSGTGAGSLYQAVVSANSTAGLDVIDLKGITTPASFAPGLPDITESLRIIGPGADQLTLLGSSPVFSAPNSGPNLILSNMTISGGTNPGSNGGGISFDEGPGGGDLRLDSVRIEGNSAASGGGIYYNSDGGNSYVSQSLIIGNDASSGAGITIVRGNLSITNSTIADNTTGQGILVDGSAGGQTILSHVTVTGNGSNGIASTNGGIVRAEYIISYGNTSDDVTAAAGTDVDFGPSGAGTSFATDNIVGTSSPVSFTDDDFVVSTDPVFDLLTTNGDHTDSYHPTDPAAVNGSDTPTGATSTELVDQTGASRTGANLTLGAIEVNAAPTGSDFTVVVGVDRVVTIVAADFGYSDGDGDAFSSIEITSGATGLFLDGNDNGVNDGEDFTGVMGIGDINLNRLKYEGTSTAGTASFTVKLSDGTNQSPDYTVTLETVENALDFDGTDDFVNISGGASLISGLSTWTIETWVKIPSPLGRAHTILSDPSGAPTVIVINADGTIQIRDNTNSGNFQTLPGAYTDDGEWHHLAFTNNGSPGTGAMYVDGRAASLATNGFTSWAVSSDDIKLGQWDVDPNNLLGGQMDEFRIWTVSRTPEQIRANASQLLTDPTSEANLVLYYDFNQGIPDGTNTGLTTLTDQSSSANDGTLNGFGLAGGATSNYTASTAFVSTAATSPGVVYVYDGTQFYDDGVYPYGVGSGNPFGLQSVGGNADLAFEITHSGLGDLTIANIDDASGGDFSFLSLTDNVVEPGTKEDAVIRFTPTTAGNRTGSFDVNSDGTPASHTVLVEGEGDGTPYIDDITWLDANPQDGDIDQVQITFTAPVDFTDGDGGGPLGLDALVFSDANTVTNIDYSVGAFDNVTTVTLNLTSIYTGTAAPAGVTINYQSGGNSSINAVIGGVEIPDGEVVANGGTYTDGAAPILLTPGSTPNDGNTAVTATPGNLTLQFSEAIDLATGNVVIYYVNGDVKETIAEGAMTDLGSSIQVPYGSLDDIPGSSIEFYVEIDDALVNDGGPGNDYVAANDPDVLNFATAGNPTMIVDYLDENPQDGDIDRVRIVFTHEITIASNPGNGAAADDPSNAITGVILETVDYDDAAYQNVSDITFDLNSGTGIINGTADPGVTISYVQGQEILINSVISGSEFPAVSAAIYNDEAEPVALSITPSPAIITDLTLLSNPNAFSIEVVYSESLNIGTDPVVSFPIEDPTADLTPNASGFTTTNFTNDTFTQSYDVVDNNKTLTDIDIDVDGADATAGPNQSATWGVSDAFSIQTGAVAPTIIAAHFFDTDDDGVIDEMVVELSEEVDETSADIDDFSLTGSGGSESIDAISLHTGSNVDNALDADDADEYVTFEVSNITVGTAITGLAVTFTKDNDGDDFESETTGLPADDNADVTEIDAAAPVIISTTSVNNAYLQISFSEPVWTDNSMGSFLVPGDFGISVTGGLNATVDVVNGSGATDAGDANTLTGGEEDYTVFYTLDGPAAGSETISIDTDGSNANQVFDGTGIAAAQNQYSPLNEGTLFASGTITIVSAEWLDTTGDGNIDAVDLIFSEDANIDDNCTGGGCSDATEGFTCVVIEDTDEGTFHTIDVGDYDVTNVITAGNTFRLFFTGDPIVGTGKSGLTATYDRASIDKIKKNTGNVEIVDNEVPATYIDGAAPNLNNLTQVELISAGVLRVYMQDEIDDSSVDGLDFTYNGVQASVSAVAQNNGDQYFDLDFGSSATVVEGDLVFDNTNSGTFSDSEISGANALVLGSQTLPFTFVQGNIDDLAAPVVVSIETEDLAGHPQNPLGSNGRIDNIKLTLSEDVTGTIDASDFSLNLSYTISAANESSAGVIDLTVDEITSGFDVDVTPNLTINASSGITDISTNEIGTSTTLSTDKIGPFAQIVSNLGFLGAPDDDYYDFTTPNSEGSLNVNVTGTVTLPASLVFVEVGSEGKVAVPDGSGNWSVNLDFPDVGIYDVEVTTFDGDGNVGSDGSISEIEIDAASAVAITQLSAPQVCIDQGFVPLGDLVFTENAAGNFGVQGEGAGSGDDTFMMIQLPSDFFFDTGITPTVTVGGGTEITCYTNYVGNAIIQLNFEVTGTSQLNTLTIGGLQVRAEGTASGGLVNAVRFAGDADIFGASTNGQVFGTMESFEPPVQIPDVLTAGGANVTEFASLSGDNFSFDPTDAGGTVNWYQLPDDMVVDFNGTVTQATPGFNTAVGLHSYNITEDNGTCEGDALTFNHLIYTYTDNSPVPNFTAGRTFNVTDPSENIIFSNPAGHIVTVTGAGIVATNSPGNGTIVATFDPGTATVGSHTISYSVTNAAGETFILQSTFDVVAASVFVDGGVITVNGTPGQMPDTDYCEVDVLSINIDLSEVTSAYPAGYYFHKLSYYNGTTAFPVGFTPPADTGGGPDVYYSPVDGSTRPSSTGTPQTEHNTETSWQIDLSTLPAGYTEIYMEVADGTDVQDYRLLFGFEIEPLPTVALNFANSWCVDDNNDYFIEASVNAVVGNISNGYVIEESDGFGGWINPVVVNQAGDDTFNPSDYLAGDYRIIYQTEAQPDAGCTNIDVVPFTINPVPTDPELWTGHGAMGGDGWIDTTDPENGFDSYVLEYCNTIPGFFIGFNSSNLFNWYNSSLDLLATNWFIPTSQAFDDPNTGAVENASVGTETVFYFSKVENGCETALRKFTVYIYEETDVPTATTTANNEEVAIDSRYVYEYCDTYTAIDLNVLDGSLSNPNSRNESAYFRLYDANKVLQGPLNNSTLDAADFGLGVGAQDTTIYISQVWNDALAAPANPSAFRGCESDLVQFDIKVFDTPLDPTIAVDFPGLAGGTVHICEGDIFSNITNTATGIDEYVWYEDTDPGAGVTLVEIATVSSGSFMSSTNLEAISSFYDNDVTGSYDFQISRVANISDETDFVGCESGLMTLTIEVHEVIGDEGDDDWPAIASTEYGSLDFGDGTPGDAGADYIYPVCISELDPNAVLTASSAYAAGPKEFVWYRSNASFATQTNPIVATAPTFDDLGMGSGDILSAQSKYFIVTQRTDIDDFAAGAACESISQTFVEVRFSDLGALSVTSTTGSGPEYCHDETDDVLVLNVGGTPVNSLLGPPPGDADNDVVWEIYADGTILPSIPIDNGIGYPTLDLDALFTAMSGVTPNTPGNEVNLDVYLIYTDPQTNCSATLLHDITIHPSPDVTFTINNSDTDNVEFCYDDGLVNLAGFYSDLSNLDLVNGTGSFSGAGINNTSNGFATFNPSGAHGGDPFAVQSSHTINFTYTDQYNCQTVFPKTILVNPRPEPVGTEDVNQIQFNQICNDDALSTEAYIEMIDPADGVTVLTDYTGYTFVWSVNGGLGQIIMNDNQHSISLPAADDLSYQVTITDTNGCTVTLNETHSKQPLPILDIVGLTDNEEFCSDDTEPTISLTDDGAATALIDIQSWSVDSYDTDDPGTFTQVAVDADGNSLPVLDFENWHEMAGGNTYVGGQSVGGPSTVHTITIVYIDPNRSYQGTNTTCEATYTETFVVNPSPNIDFEVNFLADASGSFGGDAGYTENFCYDFGLINLQGILRDANGNPIDLPAGTGSFSGLGVIPTGNGLATWNPQTANGNDPHALNATGVDVTFTFTDANGCQNVVTRTLFVDIIPDPIEVATGSPEDGDQIQFSAICSESDITAFVLIDDPNNPGNEIASYANYTFTWDLPGDATGVVSQVDNQITYTSNITNASSNHDFTIGVTITDNTTGCDIVIEEDHEVQELPELTFSMIADGNEYCAEDADVPLALFTVTDGTGEIGVDPDTDINNLNYYVTSGLQGGPFTDIYGSALTPLNGNPTIDMSQWHLDAGGALEGGDPTVHTITMIYDDLTYNEYQGLNTNCTNVVSATITIYPDSDLSFTVGGVDIEDAGFVGTSGDDSGDEICYDQGVVELVGIFGPNTTGDISQGSGTFTGPGVVPTGNNRANFNPVTAHGGNPHAARAGYTITFTYTDANGCLNDISQDLFVNPLPDPVEVTGGTPQDGDQIKFSEICEESPLVAFVDIAGVSDYTGWEFIWDLPNDASGATGTENDATGKVYSVIGDNEVTFSSETKNFTISVTIINPNTLCSFTITEDHRQQDLPDLSFDNIFDGEEICSEDLSRVITLTTNSGVIGVAAATNIADLTWSLSSSGEGGTANYGPTSGSNPNLDFTALHSAVSLGGRLVGGDISTHTLTATYIDETDNMYQGNATGCVTTISVDFTIYPDPDVSFIINNDDTDYDIQRQSGSFFGDEPASTDVSMVANHFCYDDDLIELDGLFGPLMDGYNNIRFDLGTGTFSGTGVVITGNNKATFNPAAAHDVTHAASAAPEFEPRSSHTILFTYVDEKGCENFIDQVVYVNPLPEPEDDAVKGFIQFEALCQGFPKTAEVVLLDVNTGLEVVDYSQYTFDWNLAPSSSNPTFVDNSVTFDDNNLIFTIGVTVTHNNTGCAIFKSESETQGFPPVPTFTYVGITADDNDPDNLVDGLDIYIHEDNPSLNVEDVDQGVDYLEFNLYDASNALVYSLVVEDEIDGVGSAAAFIYDDDQPVPTSADTPSVTITGLAAGEYTSELIMGSLKGCLIPDATRIITVLPVEIVGDPDLGAQYQEGFNDDNSGGWYIERAGEDGKNDTDRISSWELAGPSATFSPGPIATNLLDVTTPAEGNGMFITDWDSTYLKDEMSYVYSPAFDITLFENPAIGFQYWRDFESGRDGLVVQVSGDDGRTWVELGDNDLTSGVNWFTHQGISAGPGESARYPEFAQNNIGVGFADAERDEDDVAIVDWAEARHAVTVGGHTTNLIRFRFALAAGSNPKFSTDQDGVRSIADGFAFDDFRIYEKNKRVVVEQFSSTLSLNSKENEEYIQNGTLGGPADHNIDWVDGTVGVWINYYTDFYNNDVNNIIDPLNARNRVDPSTRATLYGISDAPATRVAGQFVPYEMDTNPEDFGNGFDAISLESPDFLIPDAGFTVDIGDTDVLSGDVRFISQVDRTDDVELLFFVAVVEKRIPANSSIEMDGIDDPDSEYTADSDTAYHVLRKLLPGPSGWYYKGPLTAGQDVFGTLDFSYDWTISGIYNEDEMRVIAFVQYYNDSQKGNSVEQSNFIDLAGKTNVEVGIEEQLAKHGYEIYPNPSNEVLNLELKDIPNEDVYYKVSDQSGREVIRGVVHRGSKSSVPIDTSDLPSGLYILQLHSEERNYRPRKVIVNH